MFRPHTAIVSCSGGEYSVTTEDGRVRPKHVLIEYKTWMCYIDGQKNKYSVFTTIACQNPTLIKNYMTRRFYVSMTVTSHWSQNFTGLGNKFAGSFSYSSKGIHFPSGNQNCIIFSGSCEEFYHLGYNTFLAVESQLSLPASCQFIASSTVQACRYKQHVPQNHQLTFSRRHGSISHS
jgi:hypothetical protein